jgi:hypothetical protein
MGCGHISAEEFFAGEDDGVMDNIPDSLHRVIKNGWRS